MDGIDAIEAAECGARAAPHVQHCSVRQGADSNHSGSHTEAARKAMRERERAHRKCPDCPSAQRRMARVAYTSDGGAAPATDISHHVKFHFLP